MSVNPPLLKVAYPPEIPSVFSPLCAFIEIGIKREDRTRRKSSENFFINNNFNNNYAIAKKHCNYQWQHLFSLGKRLI